MFIVFVVSLCMFVVLMLLYVYVCAPLAGKSGFAQLFRCNKQSINQSINRMIITRGIWEVSKSKYACSRMTLSVIVNISRFDVCQNIEQFEFIIVFIYHSEEQLYLVY